MVELLQQETPEFISPVVGPPPDGSDLNPVAGVKVP